MREIKFRAFVKHLGQLAYVLSIDFLNSFIEIYLVDRDEIRKYQFDEDEIVLLPYTGLKDKRGREIYAGDIVKTDLGNGVVVFDSGAFLVRNLDDDEYYGFDDFFSLYEGGCYLVEIISNIYENPELLGVNEQ